MLPVCTYVLISIVTQVWNAKVIKHIKYVRVDTVKQEEKNQLKRDRKRKTTLYKQVDNIYKYDNMTLGIG